MYKAHDTFFEEVKRKGCDIVLPCDEVVVFKMTADTEAVCKVFPMLCDAFGILLVKRGTATLSVNYSAEALEKNSIAFFTPNMVLTLDDADADFVLEGVCFSPAYFDDLSSYAPVYNQMVAYLNDHALPVRKVEETELRWMEMMLELYSSINTRQLHYNGSLLHLSNLLLLRLAEILRIGCASDTSKVSHPVEIYREFRKLLINNGLKKHYIVVP